LIFSIKNNFLKLNCSQKWLKLLVQEITNTLKTCFLNCLKELDPLKYPSQILCMVNEVLFSSRCEDAIKKQQLQQLQKSLKVTELCFKHNIYKFIFNFSSYFDMV